MAMLNQQNTKEQIDIEEKLENEIKNYKKMKQNCLVTFSQLTDEINELKKEIAKHSGMSEKFIFNSNNFSTVKENRIRKINIGSPIKLNHK
jgi:hypothetical protein